MRKIAIIAFIALATTSGIYAFSGLNKAKEKTECCDPDFSCCTTKPGSADCSGD